MRIIFLIILSAIQSTSFAQSVEKSTEDKIVEIQKVYAEVNEYLKKDIETGFIIDDTGIGGGNYFEFYTNAGRLSFPEIGLHIFLHS